MSSPRSARQEPLCEAYVILAKMHNALGVTARVEPTITNYFNRPYKVIFTDRFVDATRAAIRDEHLKALPADIGGVDQWADSTDINSYPDRMQKLRVLYRSAINNA